MQQVTVKKFDVFRRLRHITTVAIGAVLVAVVLVALSFAQKSTPKSCPSAEAASHALYVAVQSDSEQAVTQILGGETELVSTDDSAEDKLEREHCGQKYEEMHRLVREPDGTTVLYVGAENWPFPLPLTSNNGRWSFDAQAGPQEILF